MTISKEEQIKKLKQKHKVDIEKIRDEFLSDIEKMSDDNLRKVTSLQRQFESQISVCEKLKSENDLIHSNRKDMQLRLQSIILDYIKLNHPETIECFSSSDYNDYSRFVPKELRIFKLLIDTIWE